MVPARRLTRLTLLAVLTSAAMSGGAVAATGSSRASAAAAANPCGRTATPPARYAHVIWLWMENHSYGTVVGSSQAPFLNKTLIADCGLATNYHNISHPSLPNYVSATSGLGYAAIQRFTPDCDPTGSCTTTVPSIFSQVSSWRAYEETMPSNCRPTDAGLYAVRHNPPPYFTHLAGCSSFDVPYTQLSADLAGNKLPAFAFITPNTCNDTHDCSIATGDAWLSRNVPMILGSPAYQAGGVVLILTWDEGEGGSSNRCATNTTDVGCHVATVVISPSTPIGVKSATLFNHWSLLRTTEEMLGISTFLGQAASATSMDTAFNLLPSSLVTSAAPSRPPSHPHCHP